MNAWRKRCVPFFEAAVLKIKNAVDDARGKIVPLFVRNKVLAAAAGLAARARAVFMPVMRFLNHRVGEGLGPGAPGAGQEHGRNDQ